jgi:hypothetical protein
VERKIVFPPRRIMADSKEILVRVGGFSKMRPRIFLERFFSEPPFFFSSSPRSTRESTSCLEKSQILVKCFTFIPYSF